jgi:N-acetylmuramoyl-L-alanine amidase
MNYRKQTILTIFIVFLAFFMNANAPDLGVKKVVIDAGHGGKDSGCLGAHSQEKKVCLSIALKLGKFIEEKFPDVEVVYTRKTDVFIELHERANIANKAEADLFICIHANSGPSAAYGCETYVMGLHKNEANLNVAKRENSTILLEDNHEAHYEGFDPNSDEDIIALTLMQSTFLDQSLSVASKVQDEFVKQGRRDRGVKQAGFLVLYKTAMPSVLIETGFLTNPKEEDFLANDANQTKMANSIFKAFENYKHEVEKNLNIENTKIEAPKEEIKKEVKPKENPPLYIKEKQKEEQIIDDEVKTYSPPLLSESEKTNVSKSKLAESAKEIIENKAEAKDVKKETKTEGVKLFVQLISSTKQLELKPENFKGVENVEELKLGSVYKYVVGNFDNFEKITTLQSEVRKKGFKDAFVIAFNGDKKISVTEAKKLLNK